MSKWSEIRNDNVEETESMDMDSYVTIDAWLTEDDNEEGKVIARINCGTKEVTYLDEDAKTDTYAQEMINEVLDNIDYY
jgi:hypothetical protein